MGMKRLSDAELNQISGGATIGPAAVASFGKQVGTTACGNPLDEKGNVLFKDKRGEYALLSNKEWNDLLIHIKAQGGDPEKYLMTVPIDELVKSGFIKNMPRFVD